MRHLIILVVHLITTALKVIRPGGMRAVLAESVLAKHQLLILNRPRRRSSNLRVLDRLIAGFCTLWIKPRRFCRVAIAFKPSTLLNFHRVLVQRKYHLLFAPKQRTKPDPKGSTPDLIRAVVEMKQRNPTWGCPHIAEQINLAFGTAINKDVVRRIQDQHYRPVPIEGGPSWLTFIGNMKDSLWSPRSFSMRIGCVKNLLGIGRHGPVHAPNHRVRDSVWSRCWHGAVPDVQAGHPRRESCEISQFG
jgi:putative transposase